MIASLVKLDYDDNLQRLWPNFCGAEREDSLFQRSLDKTAKLEINEKANNLIENQHV